MRNCYFIHDQSHNQILIKTRGEEEPIVFCNGLKDSYGYYGRSFRGLFDERYIVYMGNNDLQIFEIDDELKLGKKGIITGWSNHRSFDTLEKDKVLVFDENNKLRIYKVEKDQEVIKFEKIHEIRVKGIEERVEGAMNVIVEPNGKYVLTSQHFKGKCSNLSIYEFEENYELKFRSIVNMMPFDVFWFKSLIFYDYFSSDLVFIGKSAKDCPVFIFCYFWKENEIRVVKIFSKEVEKLGDIFKMKKVKGGGKMIAGSFNDGVVEFDIEFDI